jgi:hypothetical protein
MEEADYILAFQTDHPAETANEGLASGTLQLARSLGSAEIKSFSTGDGAIYYLFKNPPPFAGYQSTEGLGPDEGPFPQWDLPVVRWGIGQQTRLEIAAPASRHAELSFSCRTGSVAQVLTVLLDGQRLDEFTLPPSVSFTNFAIPLVLSPGTHDVVIRYAVPGLGPEWHSVLYRRLRILPVVGCEAKSSESACPGQEDGQ